MYQNHRTGSSDAVEMLGASIMPGNAIRPSRAATLNGNVEVAAENTLLGRLGLWVRKMLECGTGGAHVSYVVPRAVG